MARTLESELSLPVRWQEGSSRTWENAVESARILKAEGIDRVVLVTQAFHMQRRAGASRKSAWRWCRRPWAPMGFPGDPFGGWLPEAPAVWKNGMLFNEWIGLLAYPLAYR